MTGSIPTGLFDNCPDVEEFGFTFSKCYKLSGDIPHGLFSKHSKAWNFDDTFQGLFDSRNRLIVVEDVFLDEENGITKETRFANLKHDMNFRRTFANPYAGTIPDIWNYTFATGGYNQTVFQYVHNPVSHLTNYADIITRTDYL